MTTGINATAKIIMVIIIFLLLYIFLPAFSPTFLAKKASGAPTPLAIAAFEAICPAAFPATSPIASSASLPHFLFCDLAIVGLLIAKGASFHSIVFLVRSFLFRLTVVFFFPGFGEFFFCFFYF